MSISKDSIEPIAYSSSKEETLYALRVQQELSIYLDRLCSIPFTNIKGSAIMSSNPQGESTMHRLYTIPPEAEIPFLQLLHYAKQRIETDDHANYDLHDIIQHVQMIMHAYDQQPSLATIELYKKLCSEEDKEFHDWVYAHDHYSETANEEINKIAEIIDACFDKVWTSIGLIEAMGLSFTEVWEEGALSNLKKIHPDGTVKKRADGKGLKPDGWQPPDFKQFARQVYLNFYTGGKK